MPDARGASPRHAHGLPLLCEVLGQVCAQQERRSRGHATPTIFNDELLYAKLSQSLAAGHGLAIRGEQFFFPAPLASVVLAPVWWLHSMTDAYAAAKLLNAALMSAAAFPAYWLARRIVRPSFALLTALATVAAARRILKRGGQLVILDLLSHRFERARELYADHWLGFSEVQLHQFLEKGGFRDIEVSVVSRENQSPHFQTVFAKGTK